MSSGHENLSDHDLAAWAESRMSLTVGGSGVAVYPPGTTFGPRRLEDFEFVWLLQGTAEWRYDEGGIALGPSSLLLAPARYDGLVPVGPQPADPPRLPPLPAGRAAGELARSCPLAVGAGVARRRSAPTPAALPAQRRPGPPRRSSEHRPGGARAAADRVRAGAAARPRRAAAAAPPRPAGGRCPPCLVATGTHLGPVPPGTGRRSVHLDRLPEPGVPPAPGDRGDRAGRGSGAAAPGPRRHAAHPEQPQRGRRRARLRLCQPLPLLTPLPRRLWSAARTLPSHPDAACAERAAGTGRAARLQRAHLADNLGRGHGQCGGPGPNPTGVGDHLAAPVGPPDLVGDGASVQPDVDHVRAEGQRGAKPQPDGDPGPDGGRVAVPAPCGPDVHGAGPEPDVGP